MKCKVTEMWHWPKGVDSSFTLASLKVSILDYSHSITIAMALNN